MKTIEQIKAQRDHEIKSMNDYFEVLPQAKEKGVIRNMMNQADFHESRAELLDWVLDDGDFKITSEIKDDVE